MILHRRRVFAEHRVIQIYRVATATFPAGLLRECGASGLKGIEKAMMKASRQLFALLTPLALTIVGACSALPGGKVVESATVVYTAGSSHFTAAVEVPLQASDVFAMLASVVTENPDVQVVNRKDNALLIEVAKDDKRLTGQVTKFGPDRSLLYVWADAGASGLTGRELAITVVETVCNELDVAYELVTY